MNVQASMEPISSEQLNLLAAIAWKHRDHAFILGNTKVGAALMCEDESIFAGCNVEHMYRCHDVHAEVNAITNMVTAGYKKFLAIIIVAERDMFTPCGGCMDWIFQFGGPNCIVAYQTHRHGEIKVLRADQLMPYYPK